jgi:hypothetical protein
MILFETTTSVFELMWDIALALFILRISLAYFLLSFLSGLFISYLRISELEPVYLLTAPQSELLTLPFWLLSITLWARYVIVSYEIPRVRGFRLAVGGLSLIWMLGAEFICGVVMYENGYREWIWETNIPAAVAGAVVLVLFGLMPFFLMRLERRTAKIGDSYHGHEKKTVTAALYVFLGE